MKNINIVNKIIAKKLGLPISTVAAVNSEYWKASKEKLTNCEPFTIFFKHIGSITISKHKLYSEIKRLIYKIRFTRKSEKYTETKKDKIIENAQKKLNILLQHRNTIAQDEYDKGIYRSPYCRSKKSKEDFESDID